MKAFNILFSLTIAAFTFYGLNALAIQYGYPDRLDLRNKHYEGDDCQHRSSHHRMKTMYNPVLPKAQTNPLNQ